MEGKIFYTNDYDLSGWQSRRFYLFGIMIAGGVSVQIIDEKIMKWSIRDLETYVLLHKHPDKITTTQFLDELSRLRDLPNEGKHLYHG